MKQTQQTRHALGSDGILAVVTTQEEQAQVVLSALWQTIAEFEDRFSRFLPDSELTHFNQSAGQKTPVHPAFMQMLHAMKEWNAQTKGLYNPFILPALQRAGYAGSWPTPAAVTPRTYYAAGRNAVGSQIETGRGWAKIPASTAIDAGGIGKGYLLDMLAEQASKAGITNFWFSLGGDIISAGTDEQGKPWQIGAQEARAQKAAGYFVRNTPGTMAVATSGTIKRGGVKDGKKWHHIIDPRTNMPAKTDILTATVCHANATAADVLAKCLVIVGSAAAEQFCQENHMQALIQLQDKAVHIAPEGTTNDVRFEPVR